jgi:RNA polymerase sigma factor (TIGR02999 family)
MPTPVAVSLAEVHLESGIVLSSNDLATSGANPTTDREQVTELLLQLRDGDPGAMDRLFPLVYGELRRIAHWQLQGERPGHTLGTTGLVHETYLKLVDQTRTQWRDRGHFFRVASWAMRRILVDYARSYGALRRGGGLQRVPMDEEVPTAQRGETLIALDEALDCLAAVDERLSQVVECRYFGGLTAEETAEALGVSTRTVERDWVKARAWLHIELGG